MAYWYLPSRITSTVRAPVVRHDIVTRVPNFFRFAFSSSWYLRLAFPYSHSYAHSLTLCLAMISCRPYDPEYTLHFAPPHNPQHPPPASTSSSLCSSFLGAKSFSDNLTLGAALEEVVIMGSNVNGDDTGISTGEGEGESEAGESRYRN
jgi:hypothetical protein